MVHFYWQDALIILKKWVLTLKNTLKVQANGHWHTPIFFQNPVLALRDHNACSSQLDFKVQHLFPIQNQKRNQGTLIETGRNRPVSTNQTAILAGTWKSKPYHSNQPYHPNNPNHPYHPNHCNQHKKSYLAGQPYYSNKPYHASQPNNTTQTSQLIPLSDHSKTTPRPL